jgi:hypothetical protein
MAVHDSATRTRSVSVEVALGRDSSVSGLAIDPNKGEIVACGSSSSAGAAFALFTAP